MSSPTPVRKDDKMGLGCPILNSRRSQILLIKEQQKESTSKLEKEWYERLLISLGRRCLHCLLYIFEGYAWDGPSGPAIDTKNFMVGALVHDALYQLMREKLLDADKWRETVDEELVRLTKEDGMWSLRRAWVLAGVRFGGGPSARDEVPILTAP